MFSFLRTKKALSDSFVSLFMGHIRHPILESITRLPSIFSTLHEYCLASSSNILEWNSTFGTDMTASLYSKAVNLGRSSLVTVKRFCTTEEWVILPSTGQNFTSFVCLDDPTVLKQRFVE